MRGMNSESVDLIYLDPPFNSNANYAAPIGSKAAGAAFRDTWGLDDINLAWHGEIKADYPGLYDLLQATRTIHGDSMMSYLIYMAIRIMEMRRLLKKSGSIYLHCDTTASHYLKLLMDCVFGRRNFRSEVIWKRTGAHGGAKRWGPVHDTLFLYSASKKMTWNRQFQAYDEEYLDLYYDSYEKEGRRYQSVSLTGKGTRNGSSGKAWRGINPTEKGRHWAAPMQALQKAYPDKKNLPKLTSQEKMDLLDAAGLVEWPKRGSVPRQKRYADENPGAPIQDVIMDIHPLSAKAKERVGYPTQKPVKLLSRIIAASSNSKDVVLDPFCGCATACVAAQSLGREWVGIDISPKAADLVQSRMQEELGLFFQGAHRTDIPKRTDLGKIIPYNDPRNKKYLYGEQGGYCNGCEEHFELRHFHVDHIIARAKGGTDHISNLQLLCGSCNMIKGKKSQEELIVALTDKGYIKRKMAT